VKILFQQTEKLSSFNSTKTCLVGST